MPPVFNSRPQRSLKLLVLGVFLFLSTTGFATIPPGYYDGAAGKSGAALKTALYNIIKGHTSVSYTYLWTAFYTTDDRPDGKVWDMYSDIPGGTPPYEYTFGTNQCGNAAAEGDCYSREHSFPKSWFGGDVAPMYTDLFHIIPTDQYVNNKRSDYPYAKVTSPTWTSLNGSKLGPCSTTGYSGVVFEPRDDFKGDFARNYFYMATRYENVIATWQNNNAGGAAILNGTSFPVFQTWYVNMLLEWNIQDPVSQKELDRNEAVYAIQNNRNPFIDHPEYAAAIWAPGPPEPTNYPTNFSGCNIHLHWTDATGWVIPTGYLVRMSSVGFSGIVTPVNGTPVPDSQFDKNVPAGIQEAWYSNLPPHTKYYFKVFGYNIINNVILYKTDGDVPAITETTP